MSLAGTSQPSGSVPGQAGGFHRVAFTGKASEYFGIWIVNVLLTIITLGIYSAWAKVRRNRYFFGNTVLLGRAFEYHARGLQILIGRLIVLGGLIVLNVIAALVPILVLLPTIVILVALPWLVAKGLRFSARVTSYRNVRFDFVGTAGGAFKAFILGGLLAVITLGILSPLASRWVGRYIGSNLRYGGKAFDTDPRLGPLYKSWLLSLLIALVGLAIIAFLVVANLPTILAAIETPGAVTPEQQVPLITSLVAGYVVLFVTFAVAGLFYRAGVRNITWSATTFDGQHRLMSDLSRRRYTWIAVTNVIVTLITFGLMRPWAAVRMARYTWEHTGVTFAGDVGELFARIEAQGSAIGAEFMDLEGFDFGF
ncbi:YjgN family protein [Shinella pollutisoli]|uniref:YjgN family protein n=1 Tax=Shinella pollutisoli TaxID=2250594 RepID=A0ABV7DBX7_9HYPH|nr:YjgN family protein [Shinella pollutisoli]